MSGNTGTGGPAPCLSIRQPWAWLIAHGWKNIENRTWPTGYRGRFLIHAAAERRGSPSPNGLVMQFGG